MIFRDFLEVARALVEEADEAFWHSAISRAYYAAFHVSRELLHHLGFEVPRAERAHAFLWLRLSNTGNRELDDSGRDLNDLRSERNRADYQEKPAVAQRSAKDRCRLAEKIIAAFDRVLQEPLRRQITEAIKKYERDVLKEVTWRA